MERHFLNTASWLMALCGTLLLALASADFMAAKRAEYWPTVEGRLTAVTTHRIVVGGFLPLHTWVDTSYEYPVASFTYRGSRVAYGSVLPLEFDPRKLDAGAAITVHYDPANPGEAVLFAGASLGILVYALVGLFCLAVSLGLRRYFESDSSPAKPRRRRPR